MSLSGPARLAKDCDPNVFGQLYPNGNGELICSTLAPTGPVFVQAENSFVAGGGTCRTLGLMSAPAHAKYRRFWFDGAQQFFEGVYGVRTLPPEWEFSLQ